MRTKPDLVVVGGGLAGAEAAYQAAVCGLDVWLYEMRPLVSTGAHASEDLAELVCSNSLGSRNPNKAQGLLQTELRLLGSMLLWCAEEAALPAGEALAVDRIRFSQLVTRQLENHPRIRIIREEVKEIPAGLTIVASGPLTSPDLSTSLMELTGVDHLYFYDAIAPIVYRESVNMGVAFRASRFGKGVSEGGDYINCPLSRSEYDAFVDELIAADKIPLRDFELDIANGVKAGKYKNFEGCLPIETLAARGHDALAFGPMRPIGLWNPLKDERSYAILQLRQDNLAGDLLNMVGFQTNLTFSDQRRVFRLIPGLEEADFARFGQMHRNTFLLSPLLLLPSLQCKGRSDLFFAGQLTGVEGYLGNIGTGLLAGINAVNYWQGNPLWELPDVTMLGALCRYITSADPEDFQPMKANLGLLPALGEPPGKVKLGRGERAVLLCRRAESGLAQYIENKPMNKVG